MSGDVEWLSASPKLPWLCVAIYALSCLSGDLPTI